MCVADSFDCAIRIADTSEGAAASNASADSFGCSDNADIVSCVGDIVGTIGGILGTVFKELWKKVSKVWTKVFIVSTTMCVVTPTMYKL